MTSVSQRSEGSRVLFPPQGVLGFLSSAAMTRKDCYAGWYYFEKTVWEAGADKISGVAWVVPGISPFHPLPAPAGKVLLLSKSTQLRSV